MYTVIFNYVALQTDKTSDQMAAQATVKTVNSEAQVLEFFEKQFKERMEDELYHYAHYVLFHVEDLLLCTHYCHIACHINERRKAGMAPLN